MATETENITVSRCMKRSVSILVLLVFNVEFRGTGKAGKKRYIHG